MVTKIINKPLLYMVTAIFTIAPLIAAVLSYFMFYPAWKYFSPVIMIGGGFAIGYPILYLVSTRKQYFVFIHRDGEFIFKKIVFYKSIPVDEIRKIEMYYPGPTTPEEFNKDDTELSFSKRDPSGYQMLFYLRDGRVVKVGRTYIPIAEYIRKYLLKRGVICVERYLSSVELEEFIDIVYDPKSGSVKRVEKSGQSAGSLPPPPWMREN